MSIQELLSPKNGRILSISLAIYLMGRSIYYLVAGTPEYYGSFIQGNMFTDVVFQVSVPMAIMTIMWPIIFVALNLFHKEFRLNALIFYLTIFLHAFGGLLAAVILAFDQDVVLIESGRITNLSRIYVITGISVVTCIVAGIAYQKNMSLFSASAQEPKGNKRAPIN
ncbi:hypothetical protein [Microbulbifer sp. YPW16]|uniref:hypothetical protein n=1 Tax=Microbulbifer sp. YPW16 TaxID=2904242 RepID=UPI001E5CB8A6|nr:hypothetical protein [Microbulbifer sp. YPW16]UHQ54148.1 hypothetical protein LVE68_11525 [Microbulbifer sp. YPW16]